MDLRQVEDMLISLSLWPFLNVGRMPPREYQDLIRGAMVELNDPRYKWYFRV